MATTNCTFSHNHKKTTFLWRQIYKYPALEYIVVSERLRTPATLQDNVMPCHD